MAFFARPDLSNEQFRQETGSILTLSGQTQIATLSGLTLATGNTSGTGVIITASGASLAMNNYVLTYDYLDNKIKLKESSASGGTGYYDGTSPTTCTVGGLSATTTIFNCSIVDIIECMVSPTVYPDLTNPSLSEFSIIPSTTTYEVGCSISITGTTCLNPGSIDPQYSSASSCRSWGASGYTYSDFGSPVYQECSLVCASYSFSANTITSGNNNLSATIHYSGGTQPYDSSGTVFDSPLVEGCTSTCTRTITGIFPWYWGIESSGGAASGVNRPTACNIKDIITGGTYSCKCVGYSTGTILVNFGSTNDDYIWFATPSGSTSKTCWYESALNNGSIGGVVSAGGNLFPDNESVTGVTTTCWSGETYKIYVSNYQSAASTIIELRNS